jgi:hypothetical protein
MKKVWTLIPVLLLIICISSCGGVKKDIQNTVNSGNDTVRIANDSLEYEIIIIEPGFNNWLATQRPRGFFEQFWLENRNIFLVTEFNNRVYNSTQFDPDLYMLPINYDQSIDYGYEVNYLLWNWFQFFQERNNQKLR